MIIFNASQARTNAMNNNREVCIVMDTIEHYIQQAINEGRFKVKVLLINNKLEGGEEFIKRYLENLGYTCSYTYDDEKNEIEFNINWY